MRKFYLLLLAALCIGTRANSQVTVTGSTGANGTYATLTAAGGAFAALNAAGSQAGNNIVMTVTASISTEDGTNALNGNGWTTLTVSPSGSNWSVYGTVNGPLITLNGASNVSFAGASGFALGIQNSSTGALASTVKFINDASNNTFTNTYFYGGSTGLGTIYFSTGTTTGNDNNLFSQCYLGSIVAGTSPLNGVYSLGSSAVIDNSGNTITNCSIADYFNAASASAGININSNNSGWTISNNSLFQTATRTFTTGNTHNGILITSGSGYTISNNMIGYANSVPSGTMNLVVLKMKS